MGQTLYTYIGSTEVVDWFLMGRKENIKHSQLGSASKTHLAKSSLKAATWTF